MVAKEVEVLTQSAAGGDGVRWRSTGEDAYSLDVQRAFARGTQVVLHLQEDALEYAEDARLRHIVTRYSDHIGVPVRMFSQPGYGASEDEEFVSELEGLTLPKHCGPARARTWRTRNTRSFISMSPTILRTR